MNKVEIIKYGDNYIYLILYGSKAIAVDPGAAKPVLKYIESENIELSHILVTHGHFDHTGGCKELAKSCPGLILLSDKTGIPGNIRIGPFKIRVLHTPGHSRDSLCYYFEPGPMDGMVFSGDILFVGGCGRLFGGSAEEMWNSLCTLASLSDETLVYCGHDYSQENYRFALSVLPQNKLLKNRLAGCMEISAHGRETVPSTIKEEKDTNIFLRSDSDEIRSVLKMENASAVELFAELRKRKDRF